MPEIRHDPIQKRWVIIASERSRRPTDFSVSQEPRTKPDFCPFCEGNEDKTPPEITALRKKGDPPNSPGWKTRVVPNKFPALIIEGNLDRSGDGPYDTMNGVGAHEVIIDSPYHEKEIFDLEIPQITNIVTMYRDRLTDLMKDPRFKYVLIFKNSGSVAGASLSHPHSQIIATPVTPRTVGIELLSAQAHFLNKERCLFCDILAFEMKEGKRIVWANDDFVVLVPYASRFPFEMAIYPRQHQSDFSETTDRQLQSFSSAIKATLTKLSKVLHNPPFNYLIHTQPNTKTQFVRPGYWTTVSYDFHWHLEIIPRVTKLAGFEWGTGFYICPTLPEEAASALREVN